MIAPAFDIETINVEAIHVPDAGGLARQQILFRFY